MSFAEILADKRICVCVGPGGVGKTTTAAALALGLAAGGRKVAVVTIDPARRLADALGLDELDNEPRELAAEHLGGVTLSGELWAMTLDPKQTFDELIDEVSVDAEQAQAIKQNRIYREISSAVAGSQEYTAIAKLHELLLSERFDALVLDTPPAQNALDFLDAPARLTNFLEGRTLRALLAPTGFGARLLAPMFGALKRITGVDVVSDLTDFFALIGPLSAAFSARAHGVDAVLRSSRTAFVIVTRAAPRPIDDALTLERALRARALPFSGVIVNRFVAPVPAPSSALKGVLRGELAGLVAAAVADQNALAAEAAAELRRLQAELGEEPLALVPEFDDDVHDGDGLVRISRHLFDLD